MIADSLSSMRRIAAAAVLALLLNACGWGGGSSAAERILLAAVSTTEDAGSARFEGEVSFSSPEDVPGLSGFSMNIDGAATLDGKRGRMTMSFEGLPETPGAAGLGDIELIIDGEDVYMKSSLFSQALPGSKPWLRMDVSQMVGSGFQFSQSDPTQALQYMRGVSDDVEEVGRQKIRGVRTTQYQATVDLNKAVEDLPEDAREQLETSLEMLGTSELPTSFWIDDQGRLRRMYSEFDFSGDERIPDGTKMTLSFDYFDFGVKVDVEPPPANQVSDAPSGLFAPPVD
jgi:hypothetical protein